jgi:hypothetical protein
MRRARFRLDLKAGMGFGQNYYVFATLLTIPADKNVGLNWKFEICSRRQLREYFLVVDACVENV